MPTPTVITDLSQTAASNYPAGSDAPSVLDDVQRALSAFIAQLRDGKNFTDPVTLASAGTTDIGGQNAMFVEISGAVAITSFGTTYNGPRFLRFTGALILTHAAALNLPGAANITTVAGDTCIAVPNFAGNGWNVVQYMRGAAMYAASGANTDITSLASATTATTQAAGDNSTKIATTAYADRSGVPAGTIIDFAGAAAPTGYLACPLVATNLSRTTYAALFAAIGTLWGAGDGSTTFGMPFFAANHVAVQASANVGSVTAGTIPAHTHTVDLSAEMAAGANTGSLRPGTGTNTGSFGTGTDNLAAGRRVLKCVKT